MIAVTFFFRLAIGECQSTTVLLLVEIFARLNPYENPPLQYCQYLLIGQHIAMLDYLLGALQPFGCIWAMPLSIGEEGTAAVVHHITTAPANRRSI
jgi:hypothetical protein